MNRIKALVLTGYGLNCDTETAHVLTLAGAAADKVHINALIEKEVALPDYQMVVFGGGFSWGDDHGGGVIQAVRMKTHLGDDILDFIAAGKLVLGICNGFQCLVNLGLLPGLDRDYTRRSVAVTYNDCGNFRDQWVTMTVNDDSPSVFTKGLKRLDMPVRHGEGKFYAEPAILDRLESDNLVALRYADSGGNPAGGKFPENPNGSLHDIAGICDPTGRILGLMPHPEAFNHPANHPDWAYHNELQKRGKMTEPFPTLGLSVFENAVAYLSG